MRTEAIAAPANHLLRCSEFSPADGTSCLFALGSSARPAASSGRTVHYFAVCMEGEGEGSLAVTAEPGATKSSGGGGGEP